VLNGGYVLFRLLEFLCIFAAVARLPLTAGRAAIIRRILDAVIAVIAVGNALIYFGMLPLSALAWHLPQSPGVAGPWSDYARLARLGITTEGLSTVGYNHTYVAAQLLALVALRIHLAGARRDLSNAFILLLAIAGCFLSGSRAGLLGILIFAAAYWLHRPRQMALIGGVGAALWLALATAGISLVDLSLAGIVARQRVLLAATDPDNLGGRVEIWQGKIAYLNEQPLRWLIGGGLGVITTPGRMQNAHLLYLQIVVDTGLIGLAAFILLVTMVLVSLWRRESRPRAIFWATIALLIASLTQETFYPVAALGHFLGLYLCCLALTMGHSWEANPAQAPVAAPAPTASGVQAAPPALSVAHEER
jgi:O-antigen ligase